MFSCFSIICFLFCLTLGTGLSFGSAQDDMAFPPEQVDLTGSAEGDNNFGQSAAESPSDINTVSIVDSDDQSGSSSVPASDNQAGSASAFKGLSSPKSESSSGGSSNEGKKWYGQTNGKGWYSQVKKGSAGESISSGNTPPEDNSSEDAQ